MNDEIFINEKNHLDDTVSKIRQAKDSLLQAMKSLGAETLSRLEDLRKDPETGADFTLMLDQLHEKNEAFNLKDKYVRLEEFSTLIKEPYFARIDLLDTHTKKEDQFYIGKFGYSEDNPIVIDWRAKVASVYYRYRYPQKNVQYNTPDGVMVRDLSLKRTFEIDNSELTKYYNNDIKLDETQIISDKIAGRTGGVLEDIVETIQVSQLDIIESDPRKICIVQGCVGSGKSTVAIHKLSHIFFNFPNIIHPERSILIAKNQILVGYLSTLFPKLGIFDINYKTLRELVYKLIFREKLNLKVDFSIEKDLSSLDVESIRAVKNTINEIFSNYEARVIEIFELPEYESFGGFVFDKRISIYSNLNELIDDLEEESVMQRDYLKEAPGSTRAWLFKENIKILRRLIDRVRKIRNEVDGEMHRLIRSLKINPNTTLDYLQTLIYVFAYSELIGLQSTKKYEYCVVDEGQDFSVLEYSILGKLVMNGRFCILGDLNQSYQGGGLKSWDDISEVVLEAGDAETFELDTNYRSTKPIIDLANQILAPYTENYLPKSINRIGVDITAVQFGSEKELFAAFEKDIARELKDLDKSIGVICYGNNTLAEARAVLDNMGIANDKYVQLDENKPIHYIPKGVYLTRFEDCKGLEFAKVYVLNLNLDKVHSFIDAKKAFVAVTRAMNEVHVLGIA